MLSERLQILVSPEQRRRLEAEARRRGTSVGSLIREAVDHRFQSVPEAERRQAVDDIRRMRGRFLSPGELNRIVEAEREGDLDPAPASGDH
ncbi:MAG: ribbon-helix-helix protein, CopG family [Solirubrobacterales bacterium]